jgi:hypothetical protein
MMIEATSAMTPSACHSAATRDLLRIPAAVQREQSIVEVPNDGLLVSGGLITDGRGLMAFASTQKSTGRRAARAWTSFRTSLP